jgi:FkbM family methyltransferase
MNDAHPPLDTKGIEVRLDSVAERLQQLIQLQQFAMLGQERVIEFVYEDNIVALHIPFALTDFIQRRIFAHRTFYEEKLLRKMRQMALFDPNGAVFDIGANIGNHAVFFGKIMQARHVTCFEPQNVASRILAKNIALNSLQDRTTVVRTLLGEKSGKADILSHSGRNLGGTSFAESQKGAFDIIALDDYCIAHRVTTIDFMKIDVEGMQLSVLTGARQVLGDLKPVLWVELIAANDEFAATQAFLQGFGYRATALDANNFMFTA